jgi:solute:Na+ symporter, SSS family
MVSIVFVVLFIVMMVVIGFWGMKKTATLGDFFIGGRKIGPWISSFAFGTTYFSAVIFIGFAGKLGWGFGLNVLWIAAGNALFGSLLAWLALGSRTRRMTQNLEVMTMPEFLHERYQGKYMKLITAGIIFFFLIPYSASVFKGLGYLFEANFHISFNIALLIMIAITGVYLIMGGYFAVTLTDFIQGMIMLVGSVVMVAVLVGKGGGLAHVLDTIRTNYPAHVPPGKQPSMILLGALVFMTSFGTWGMPQMVQKFYSIKDESLIKKAAIITFIFAVVITFAAYFTGAMTHVFFNAPILNSSGKPAFDMMIPTLLTTQLPEALMALILLLVLSASMSTLSSLVLISASSVAIDMYKGHVNPNISKENSLAMMRFLSAVFIAVSYFIARYDFSIIITLMSLSWGVVAGSFMAPYIYGIYWKRTTRAGAKAGMFTGMILAIGLFYKLGPANSPIASSIAMIVPFIVVPVVSLFTKPPAVELIDKAFANIK